MQRGTANTNALAVPTLEATDDKDEPSTAAFAYESDFRNFLLKTRNRWRSSSTEGEARRPRLFPNGALQSYNTRRLTSVFMDERSRSSWIATTARTGIQEWLRLP